ncbi:MAG TPA: 2OG-Fe(II) oxygenase [Coleofasciculaceae cyanobacterium]|jgi:Rps23 Pro-64 3,4-dihydroxylase Tpa1-like proline 4-hydroxylase
MQLITAQFDLKIIKVQILLTGGHQYTIYLQSDEPLLHELLTALATRSQTQAAGVTKLFQVSLDGGRSSLYFPSENLVAIVTEPPVFLQAPQVQSQPTKVLVAQYVQIDQFLSPEEQEQLLTYTKQRESDFVSTGATTNTEYYPDHRNSFVLYTFPNFSELIVSRIRAIIPDVLRKLGAPLFSISTIEAQLTVHKDSNYYKIHNDNGSPETATRELTFVYYFYREPKQFSGGELLIYDTRIENNRYFKADSFKTVEPRNNSIVFFQSCYLHEVLPVSCPSQAFADSRFTVNGWVRR